MARTLTIEAARAAFGDSIAAALTPASVVEYRVDRLLELRAVIDSLRSERGQELLLDARAEIEHASHSWER